MLEHGFARSSVITRLRRGPLGPHLETLATTLHQHGYARNSIRGYLRACAQFGRWLAQQGYTIADVDATLVTRYLRGLPQPPRSRSPKAAAGLPHLLTLWQQQGLLPPAAPPPPRTTADRWLERYTQYLEHVCGAAASTRTRYRCIITRFLSACGDTGPQGWSALQAQDITTFIQQEAATTHGAGRKMPSVAVRVVYLQPAGNSDRLPIQYNAPFTTGVKGLCHGIPPRCLPARADRLGVVVSDALLVVAIGARSRSTDTIHASAATTQTLHSAQTLYGSHPQAPLRRLCASDRSPQASAAFSSTPEDRLNPWTSAPRQHLMLFLSRCGLSLWRLGGAGQSPCQRASQRRPLAPAALHQLWRLCARNARDAVSWQARRARLAGVGHGCSGRRVGHPRRRPGV